MSRRLVIAVLLALAACGKQGALTPVPPRPAPQQATDAVRPPTAEEMLRLPPQSAPVRADDPVKSSHERPDDRFNLPPPGARL